MKSAKLISVFLTASFALTLLHGCEKVDPEVVVPINNVVPVETFSLDCVPTLKVSTLGGAEINHRSSYTKGASCVLEYTETSSLTNESVARSVDFGGFSIKGRGNSTWGYPKKPYLINFDLRQEVLSMGKGHTWCLLANWMDKTLLRNDVAFEVASRCTGLDWTPKGEFVELELNGKDMGLYYLCPHISLSGSRVDAGDDGVIFEVDVYYDEPYKFRSGCDLPIMIKDFEVAEGEDEDVLSDERLEKIQNQFIAAEAHIKSVSACLTDKYVESYDIDSMVDFYLVNEIIGNCELCHPKSVYMYFNSDERKYYFGPVWDFDWWTLVPNVSGLLDSSTLWYKYLFSDPLFVSTLKERWALLKPSLSDMNKYIINRRESIQELAEKNFEMWPISSTVNGDEGLSYMEAVNRLIRAFNGRVSTIDASINSL